MSTTLDVLTVDEARGAINAQGDNATDWLDLMTTAVSTAIDFEYGPMVARMVTELHDGGGAMIVPYSQTVLAVTSVTEYQGLTARALNVEALGTAQQYGYTFSSGVLYRRAGGFGYQFWPGQKNVQLVLSVGRADDTGSVPATVKSAAQITLAHLWDLKNGRGDPQFADSDALTSNKFLFPWRAKELLQPFKLMPAVA